MKKRMKERKDNDSSDEDPEDIIRHIKHDFSHEIGLSDKIKVVKGELINAEGVVKSIDEQ